MTQVDKAGKNYWDDNWSKIVFPEPFDRTNTYLDNYVQLNLDKYFQKILTGKEGFSVLEIGCANSIWPIYFHQYYKAKVYGLDYSEVGCRKSIELLQHYNIPNQIYCANLFDPPTDLLQKFDVVVSFGVVEHFENTAQCLKSCAAFVKPGGYLITLIPNMSRSSIIGFLQKLVDRSVYEVHVPLTKKMFVKAHEQANLTLKECDYFMSINLSVVNSGAFSNHPFNKYFRHGLSAPSKILWILERYGFKIPENPLTSPYLIAVSSI